MQPTPFLAYGSRVLRRGAAQWDWSRLLGESWGKNLGEISLGSPCPHSEDVKARRFRRSGLHPLLDLRGTFYIAGPLILCWLDVWLPAPCLGMVWRLRCPWLPLVTVPDLPHFSCCAVVGLCTCWWDMVLLASIPCSAPGLAYPAADPAGLSLSLPMQGGTFLFFLFSRVYSLLKRIFQYFFVQTGKVRNPWKIACLRSHFLISLFLLYWNFLLPLHSVAEYVHLYFGRFRIFNLKVTLIPNVVYTCLALKC